MMDVVFRDDTVTKPSSVDVSLFNDSTDALTDSNDIGDVTTEPTGSAFARQTVNVDSSTTPNFTVSDASGDWEASASDVVFDTSDSSQTVDSYFVVVNFQSDDTSDSSANDHLFWTGSLSQSYDLSNVDELTVQDVAGQLT